MLDVRCWDSRESGGVRTGRRAPRIARGRRVDFEFVDALHGSGIVPEDLTARNQEDAQAPKALDVERVTVVRWEVSRIKRGLFAFLGAPFRHDTHGELHLASRLALQDRFVWTSDPPGDVACGDFAGTKQYLQAGAMGPDARDGDAFAGFEDQEEMKWGRWNRRSQSVQDHRRTFRSARLASGFVDAAIGNVRRRAEPAKAAHLGCGDNALEGFADGIEVEWVTHSIGDIASDMGAVQGWVGPIYVSGGR